MKAFILAAGRGERMRPLTDRCPKPLLEVGGRPLIVHLILALANVGIRELVINTAYLAEHIHAELGDGKGFGVSIKYSDEGVALETGGAVARATPLLGDGPFLLINGDVWTDLDFDRFASWGLKHVDEGAQAALALVPNPSFKSRGDFHFDSDDLHLKVSNNTVSGFTFAGISVLDPALVTEFPRQNSVFPLRDALHWAADNGRLVGRVIESEWCDVGTPERLAALDINLRV